MRRARLCAPVLGLQALLASCDVDPDNQCIGRGNVMTVSGMTTYETDDEGGEQVASGIGRAVLEIDDLDTTCLYAGMQFPARVGGCTLQMQLGDVSFTDGRYGSTAQVQHGNAHLAAPVDCTLPFGASTAAVHVDQGALGVGSGPPTLDLLGEGSGGADAGAAVDASDGSGLTFSWRFSGAEGE